MVVLGSWKVADVSANWLSGFLERVGELDFWQTDAWHGLQQIGNPTESANWISGEVSANWETGFLAFWLSAKCRRTGELAN